MQPGPRFINLYDKPLHPRPSFALRRHAEPGSFGTPILSCATIVALVVGFFWVYDAIAHRGAAFVPAPIRSVEPRDYRNPASKLIAAEAPAPDMNSPAVSLANADADAPQRPDEAAAKPVRKTEHKKKPRTTRRVPAEATRTYASDFKFLPANVRRILGTLLELDLPFGSRLEIGSCTATK